MISIIRVRKVDPILKLRVRGLDNNTFTAIAESNQNQVVAAIIAPPGRDGIDLGEYPEILDGGNF